MHRAFSDKCAWPFEVCASWLVCLRAIYPPDREREHIACGNSCRLPVISLSRHVPPANLCMGLYGTLHLYGLNNYLAWHVTYSFVHDWGTCLGSCKWQPDNESTHDLSVCTDFLWEHIISPPPPLPTKTSDWCFSERVQPSVSNSAALRLLSYMVATGGGSLYVAFMGTKQARRD